MRRAAECGGHRSLILECQCPRTPCGLDRPPLRNEGSCQSPCRVSKAEDEQVTHASCQPDFMTLMGRTPACAGANLDPQRDTERYQRFGGAGHHAANDRRCRFHILLRQLEDQLVMHLQQHLDPV